MFLFLYNLIDLYKRTLGLNFQKALEGSPESFCVFMKMSPVNENQYFNLPMQIGESVLFLWYNRMTNWKRG